MSGIITASPESRKAWDDIISRRVPSQLPTHVTIESYARIVGHCSYQTGKHAQPFYGCTRTGERIKARMVTMRIYDRATGEQVNYSPVVTLYCPACHPIPDTHRGDSIFSDQLQTMAV